MTVGAMGIGENNEVAVATNKNNTYNGCKNIPGKCGCTHAEVELLKLMPNPVSVILTHSPCLECAKVLHKAGVTSVYFIERYRLEDGIKYLEDNDINIFEWGQNG